MRGSGSTQGHMLCPHKHGNRNVAGGLALQTKMGAVAIKSRERNAGEIGYGSTHVPHCYLALHFDIQTPSAAPKLLLCSSDDLLMNTKAEIAEP